MTALTSIASVAELSSEYPSFENCTPHQFACNFALGSKFWIKHNAGLGTMPSRLVEALSASALKHTKQGCVTIVSPKTIKLEFENCATIIIDPRALKRLEILTLFICGEKHERIASLAGCSRSTVGRVLTAYAEDGLDKTLRFHEVVAPC